MFFSPFFWGRGGKSGGIGGRLRYDGRQVSFYTRLRGQEIRAGFEDEMI